VLSLWIAVCDKEWHKAKTSPGVTGERVGHHYEYLINNLPNRVRREMSFSVTYERENKVGKYLGERRIFLLFIFG
jgi:hypothetical protein